jgi:hypothetical protein
MTQAQQQFCKDVAQALDIWHTGQIEDKPEYELNKECERKYEAAVTEYKESEQNDDDTYRYYRKMNAVLQAASGAGIPELIGTGNAEADFDRAMAIVD